MWLRLRGLLLVTLIAIAAGGVWLGLDDRFYIQRADVTGAVRVSSGEVFRASGLPGLHILWARPSEIEKRILEALPTLESVSDHTECGVYAGVGANMRLSAGDSGYEPIAGHSTELAGTA